MDTLKKYADYLENEMKTYSFFQSDVSPSVPYSPQMLYIEPTNACNLKCVFCARHKMHRQPQFLSLDQFKFVIDALIKENITTPYITITGNGEPLLNRDIFMMIRYAKEKGFNVSIISNATLLDADKARNLIDSGVDRCQFSFDSIEKCDYEQIRRNANFEKTLLNILNFLKMNKEGGFPVYVSISSVLCSLTESQQEKYLAFWKSLPVDNVYSSWLYTLQGDSGLYDEASKSICGKAYRTCSLPWRVLSVAANGDMKACPQDFNNTYVLGNAFQNSIREIWNGEKMQKLRQALLRAKLDEFTSINHDCAKCNAPYTDKWNSIEEGFNDIALYAARMAFSFLHQGETRISAPIADELKYQNLLSKINLLNAGRSDIS